jgi:hypothetical protein
MNTETLAIVLLLLLENSDTRADMFNELGKK